LAIGVLTFLGPVLVKPEYGLIWFWFSWAIAPRPASSAAPSSENSCITSR
jgi:hypothetical protein